MGPKAPSPTSERDDLMYSFPMGFRQALSRGWTRWFRVNSAIERKPGTRQRRTESKSDAPIGGVDPLLAEALLQLLHQVSDGKKPGRSGTFCADTDWGRDLIATIRQLTAHKIARLQTRIEELSAASRDSERAAGNHELAGTRLRDEIAYCRELILDQYTRHGLPAPAETHTHLRDELSALFTALAERDPAQSPRLDDPIVAALERLIASDDPRELDRFPDWMRRPAAGILEVIAERNRYRRLLEHAGMLPQP